MTDHVCHFEPDTRSGIRLCVDPTCRRAERASDRLAHPAPEQVAGGREGAWLIERRVSTTPNWWSLKHKWTGDASKAIRFSRQVDAEAFIDFHCLQPVAKATEHLWLDATFSPGVSPERIEGAGEDNPFTFDFVQALSKATFDQKFGLNAWRDTNDDVRRVWINQTQYVIQTARLEADLSARGGA